MELRVLRYFLTVAREENISRAAEALFITQPTLSRQLAELEEELGTKLFLRGKRKITLTEDGILLRRRAEEMLELENKIESEFCRQTEKYGGVISIGTAEASVAKLLPEAVARFRARYPGVTFDIYSDIADHILDRLDMGLIDVAILIEPGDIDKYEFMRLPYEDRCGILMNASSPLAGKEYVTIDDLMGLPVIANKREGVQRFYRNVLGEKYDKLNVIATFNLINNAALFALQNRGYVFTIEGTMTNYRNEELCFRPFFPEVRQTPYLVWKKYQPVSRAVNAFIHEIGMLIGHDAS